MKQEQRFFKALEKVENGESLSSDGSIGSNEMPKNPLNLDTDYEQEL